MNKEMELLLEYHLLKESELVFTPEQRQAFAKAYPESQKRLNLGDLVPAVNAAFARLPISNDGIKGRVFITTCDEYRKAAQRNDTKGMEKYATFAGYNKMTDMLPSTKPDGTVVPPMAKPPRYKIRWSLVLMESGHPKKLALEAEADVIRALTDFSESGPEVRVCYSSNWRGPTLKGIKHDDFNDFSDKVDQLFSVCTNGNVTGTMFAGIYKKVFGEEPPPNSFSAKSCMADSSVGMFYDAFPCGIVYATGGEDDPTPTARCLIWYNGTDIYFDRVYVSRDAHILPMLTVLKNNDAKQIDAAPSFRIKGSPERGHDYFFPYVDNMCYFDMDRWELSNSQFPGSALLHDTTGELEPEHMVEHMISGREIPESQASHIMLMQTDGSIEEGWVREEEIGNMIINIDSEDFCDNIASKAYRHLKSEGSAYIRKVDWVIDQDGKWCPEEDVTWTPMGAMSNYDEEELERLYIERNGENYDYFTGEVDMEDHDWDNDWNSGWIAATGADGKFNVVYGRWKDNPLVSRINIIHMGEYSLRAMIDKAGIRTNSVITQSAAKLKQAIGSEHLTVRNDEIDIYLIPGYRGYFPRSAEWKAIEFGKHYLDAKTDALNKKYGFPIGLAGNVKELENREEPTQLGLGLTERFKDPLAALIP